MKIAGQPIPHESAQGHVTGEALYTDDLLRAFPESFACMARAGAARARAADQHLDATPRCPKPGVCDVLTAADVPGEGDSGSTRHDEPLFPDEVLFHQQPVAWVLADTLEAARLGAERVR